MLEYGLALMKVAKMSSKIKIKNKIHLHTADEYGIYIESTIERELFDPIAQSIVEQHPFFPGTVIHSDESSIYALSFASILSFTNYIL